MDPSNQFDSPLVKLKRISPLIWGFGLIIIAFLLTRIPIGFFKTLAILPLIIGGLLIYQAIYNNKY